MPRVPRSCPLAALLIVATLASSACAGATAGSTPLPTPSMPSAPPAAAPAAASPTPSGPVAPAASGSSPGAPSAAPSAPPLAFTSPRYPYSITLTADWTVFARPGQWKGFILESGTQGTDSYTDSAVPVDWNFEVGFLPVASDATLASWVAAEAPRTIVSDCAGRTPGPPTSVGGHLVVLQRVGCPQYFVLNAFLVDGRQGVLLQWLSPLGQEVADQAEFLAILATLKLR